MFCRGWRAARVPGRRRGGRAPAVSLLLASLVVAFLPGTGEGLFWRNPIAIYSLACGLFAVSAGLLLRARRAPRPAGYFVAAGALLAWLGGSNFISALTAACGLFLVSGMLLWRRDRQRLPFLALFFVSLSGLLVTVCAPGNFERAKFFEQESVVRTILRAIGASVQFAAGAFTQTPLFLFAALAAALALPAIRAGSFSFPAPVLVLGAAWAWFAAHFAPTIYASGAPYFEYRVVNTYFVALCVLAPACAVYLAGWASKRGMWNKLGPPACLTGAAAVLIALAVGRFAWSGVPIDWGCNAGDMVRDLSTGRAASWAAYVDDCTRRIEAGGDRVALPPYTGEQPRSLGYDFATADETNGINRAVAGYFGKAAVFVEE